MPELSAYLLLSVLLIFSEDGYVSRAEGGVVVSPGPAVQSEDNANFTAPVVSVNRQTHQQEEHQAQTPSVFPPAAPLTLKVRVKDASSQRYLGGASVDVFVNGSQTHSTLTQENGEVLLTVPYRLGLTLTIVAGMKGYMLTQLPWKTTKMPIFSSVTLALLPQTPGNILLFEDTVLITRKISDLSSQPSVQFSKSLLVLPDSTNISTVTAYLTVPQPPLEKNCYLCTTGILNNRSGYMSVRLSPVAVLSAQLLSSGKEIQVSGPIQLTVPLPYNSRARASDSIPAWAFDMSTGAWVNKGMGTVKKEGGHLVWTYVAPHLGNWIAAPLPASNGYMGHATSMDFISYHTYLLMGILGGTLVIVIGFLSVLLCHCSRVPPYPPFYTPGAREQLLDLNRAPERRGWNSSRMAVLKRDQTTSTNCDEGHELLHHHGDRSYSLASRSVGHQDASASPRHQGNYNIYVENVGRPMGKLYENIGSVGPEGDRAPLSNLYVNSDEVARLREMSEQNAARHGAGENVVFRDKLFHIYNQPVAVTQAPELFSAQGQADAPGCRSATFPRNSMEHGLQATEHNYKDSFTQTLPKIPQQDSDEQQVLEGPQSSASNPGIWGRYSHLLESVSVPGTLNEAARMGPFRGALQGISEQTLLELSKTKPSPHPPRAWFVSLEGKPVAQVRHSVIELQGRRRPGSSNDTSLDSGVDMNELQPPLRKRERDGPSGARAPKAGMTPAREEQDLSSSEIGSPEDGALRNALEGSSAAIPNIPEDKDAGDTSSESRSTPPPRRLRKVRDKSRPDKKTTRHVREERPHAKR